MCPSLEDLYLKAGDVIEESWYKLHYDIHKSIEELLAGATSVIRYGYVYGDLVPYQDSVLDVGKPELRFNNVFAMTGYFDNNVFIQGRRALKDGDPISLYDIYAQAQQKITYAIDDSYYVSLTLPINEKLADVLLELEEQKRKLDEIYNRLNETLDVDILASESTVSDLLRGVATDGELIILTPSYGYRISTRSWHIQSTSTSGIIFLIFPQSGRYVGALMCAKGFWAGHNMCNITGYENEPLKLVWEGLSPNPDIFYQVTYKEV